MQEPIEGQPDHAQRTATRPLKPRVDQIRSDVLETASEMFQPGEPFTAFDLSQHLYERHRHTLPIVKASLELLASRGELHREGDRFCLPQTSDESKTR